jgi:hypothetical protein
LFLGFIELTHGQKSLSHLLGVSTASTGFWRVLERLKGLLAWILFWLWDLANWWQLRVSFIRLLLIGVGWIIRLRSHWLKKHLSTSFHGHLWIMCRWSVRLIFISYWGQCIRKSLLLTIHCKGAGITSLLLLLRWRWWNSCLRLCILKLLKWSFMDSICCCSRWFLGRGKVPKLLLILQYLLV